MGMQPGLGVVAVQSARSYHALLANSDYIIMNGMLASYDVNDFRQVVGTASSFFPAGALLGFRASAAGNAWMEAMEYTDGAEPINPADNLLYTWSAAGIAARGRLSGTAIPATPANNAVVLTKDTDTFDSEVSDLNYIVPFFWKATFKANGIFQDIDSFGATPWPSVDNGNSRLQIVPGLV